jgi:hypothetical protein
MAAKRTSRKSKRSSRSSKKRRSNAVAHESAASLRKRGYTYWRQQPALDSGHFDNLVFNDGAHRVWVSRMTVADYGGDRAAWLRERLTIEKLKNGSWVKV